jgi:hypothetical protein
MSPAIETWRHVMIPMPDGVRLSANIWKPVGPDGERFPVVLEYIPYRKDDWRWASDQVRMSYLAAHGFVGVRVDIRGTGSSEGVALDEYSPAETDDGVALIAWLAEQPWCNGRVGMWGISYGGFTAIQIAARRPPALKAIVPMYATDDRYSDDVHYFGGAPTASDLAQYAVSQIGMNALPPRPSYAGPDWRAQWRARLEATPPWWPIWLRHQTDGPYWRQGSLAPGYDAITCAVFNIGGWSDGYPSAALRMQSQCQAPSLTVIGNWGHLLPDNAYPGPNVNWLDQMLRFFGHWLRGDDNGVMADPPLLVHLRDFAPPERFPATWPGRWVAYDPDSVRNQNFQRLHLMGAALTASPAPATLTARGLRHDPAWGTCGPLCSGGGSEPNGLAVDLRPDEATALTYTGPVAEAPLEIFGWPLVDLQVQVDAPVAHVACWLSAVAPDGTSALITWGALNLTHRQGHDQPLPLPDAPVRATIQLKPCAYRLAPGHRLRLTVGSTHWPLLWPAPYAHTLTVLGGALSLPVAPPVSLPLPPWLNDPLPETESIGRYQELPSVWRYTEDELARTRTCHLFGGDEQRLPDGTVIRAQEAFEITADRRDPAHHRLDQQVEYRLIQDGADIRVRSSGTLRSDAQVFDLTLRLTVELDGAPFFARDWNEQIPRVLC